MESQDELDQFRIGPNLPQISGEEERGSNKSDISKDGNGNRNNLDSAHGSLSLIRETATDTEVDNRNEVLAEQVVGDTATANLGRCDFRNIIWWRNAGSDGE